MRHAIVLLSLLLLAPACPPDPKPPPGPDVADAGPTPGYDAGSADACSAGCQNLKALGCPEADDMARCVEGCRKSSGVIIAPKAVACWGSASSASSARACGSVECRR